MTTETPAEMGHNNPPADYVADLAKHEQAASAYADDVANWLKENEAGIASAEKAEECTDLITRGRKGYKEADDCRAGHKKPVIELGKAIDAKAALAKSAFEGAGKKLKDAQTAWLKKVAAEQAAEAERKAAEARKAQEEADRIAAQAQANNDAMAEAQAEEAQKAAAKMQKDAERTAKKKTNSGSATGGGRTVSLRTVKTAQIENLNLVYRHFSAHPDVRDVLQRLATAAIRSGEEVPGATKHEDQVAA